MSVAVGGTMQAPHVPVLLAEVLAAVAPADGDLVVDGTFGAGGYTTGVLQAADARVIAIDRDPAAIAAGRALAARYASRLTLINGRFGEFDQLVRSAGWEVADAVMLDIGVSSMQLDQAERGFSFRADGPLDMRMGSEGPSAADLVATLDETTLADTLFQLGEERRSRAIARAIVKARTLRPVTTTRQLADIVSRVLGPQRGGDIHPATRTFQALRIAVNDELGELVRGLAAAERLLQSGGRLAVVTFHSLEDRIVKRFLQITGGREPSGSRHLPPTGTPPEASFRIVNQRPISPSDAEARDNPRARSAKLRSAVRTGAAPLQPSAAALGLPAIVHT